MPEWCLGDIAYAEWSSPLAPVNLAAAGVLFPTPHRVEQGAGTVMSEHENAVGAEGLEPTTTAL